MPCERESPEPTRAAVTELEATIHAGGFWRLVPDCVPRTYDPVTDELMERVLHGLRRLANDEQ
ncbi:hypothetical protein OG292_18315 [Streptomyces sp. NBC_01511]|uniref:hypothetical protein n=1 Tax=unclassified Streptomyces TaxID=2593676 RepID=UPI003870CA11